jgi:LacI family transcriptional regulator
MAQDQVIVGIILWYLGGDANLPTLQALRAARIPLLFIDRRPPADFAADYVGVDNEQAAEEVVKHLLARGHRSIAHVSNFDTASTVMERLAGYRHALTAAGIPFRPELVQKAPDPPGDHTTDGCETLLDTLLSLPDPPTALFAVNDYVALRLLAILRGRNIRVPEDIAIAGFDGIERWMPGKPFLTTANQPFERIGRRAVEILLQRIEKGPASVCQHILLEAPLSAHASTHTMH